MKKISFILFSLTGLLLLVISSTQSNGHVNPLPKLQYKMLPVRNKSEFDTKTNPGDNAQYMPGFAWCESDPDRIYMGQDMGGVWVSLDAGRSWNNLKNLGLFSKYIIGLEVDPIDKNLLFAMAHTRTYDKTHTRYQGLYRSADGGITWKRVIERSSLGMIRQNTRNIAFAPSTKDKSSGHANRWYTAFCQLEHGQDGLFYSDDAGENWKVIRTLPTSLFGDLIIGLRVDPINKEMVYMYGNLGLFRFTDATNPDGAYEKLSGKNGLPEGAINGNFYIDLSGKKLIVAVTGKGIFRSDDSGERWYSIYDWKNIEKVFVNEGFPECLYATASRESGEQVRVSHDGGKNWNTKVNSTPVPGMTGSWNTHIFGSFAWIIPDPRNPDLAFAHGNAKHHQTTDGGKTWIPSNDFFCGVQHAGVNHEQMFDPNNPDRFCYFTVDEYVWYTETRGQWFYHRTADKKTLDLSHSTCNGGAMHPDASTGVILVSVGRLTGQLLRSENNGTTWEKVRSGNKMRWYVSFDQQNPNYCYQWRERSSDTGKTWTELKMPKGAVIAGMSWLDGKVLYAIDAEGESKNIWKSEDRGDSWKKVISTDYKLTSPGDPQFVFRIHPKNHNIVYTKSPDGQISKWDLNQQEGKQRTDFDVFNGEPQEEGFYATRFAIDRRHPEVMYILNLRDYTGNKFFRSQDGGLTWENISEGFPNTVHSGLEVSPITGEVFLSGGNGSRVLLPPYPTRNTAWELIQSPYRFIDKKY